jgi:hypothetical protein
MDSSDVKSEGGLSSYSASDGVSVNIESQIDKLNRQIQDQNLETYYL